MLHRPAALALSLLALALPAAAVAQVPPPVDEKAMADWSFPWGDDVPGVLSAASLIDKPAGKHGPVVAKGGHFYAGDKRIKFVGVNVCFAGNFPPKEQADAIAKRFAAFGVNCVRFHHMDMQTFPNGIFAGADREAFHPEALDRLDYFVAALKKEGVYANLNLHVSRQWSKVKNWPGADKLPSYDKQVDIFHPELIEANKKYARDLLTHVNAYTKTRYADEPAVAMVEINNEDTIFLWGGEQNLANLPEPYAAMLQKQWNEWLAKKYGTREKLATAWSQGEEKLGEELITSPAADPKGWKPEQQGGAKMTVKQEAAAGTTAGLTKLDIAAVSGTSWHLQYGRPGIKLQKGKFYTVAVDFVGADKPRTVNVNVSMARSPWKNLGLERAVEIPANRPAGKPATLGFVAGEDDDNARLQIVVGGSAVPVTIAGVSLREGGRVGLREGEDIAAGTVARGGKGAGDSPMRMRDWYAFLQHTDESYFVGMRDWLQKELGVKALITGTIGLGMLGTKSQSKMDFVDAHMYWDHPRFPRRQWDMKDWVIDNKPMVDDPAGAALWTLAATRVDGKPFTVTEYNHAAPNDWQAEAVPMVFAYAALQDWDAVFLFDYTGGGKWEKQFPGNFFSVEGNPAKWSALPLAARAFLAGGVQPLMGSHVDRPPDDVLLDTASRYFHHQWPFLRDERKLTWELAFGNRLAVSFEPKELNKMQSHPADQRVRGWSAAGAGTGRFVVSDHGAAVFVGFAKGSFPIDAGAVKITKLETPFAAIQVVPAAAGQSLAAAPTLLVSAVARVGGTGAQWDAKRTTVADKWGTGPAKVEVVRGEIEIAAGGAVEAYALGADGKRLKAVPVTVANGKATITLGTEGTVWYEIVRK